MANLSFDKEPKTERMPTIDSAKTYIEHGDALVNQWQVLIPENVKKFTRDESKPKKGGIF